MASGALGSVPGCLPRTRPATPARPVPPTHPPTCGYVSVVQPLHYALDEVGEGWAIQRLALHHLWGQWGRGTGSKQLAAAGMG